MSIFKSLFGKSEDDRLFDEFIKANHEYNASQAEKCIDRMSDEGLLKATAKIDNLVQKDPSYIILNTMLFSAYTKRPHLRNPFI